MVLVSRGVSARGLGFGMKDGRSARRISKQVGELLMVASISKSVSECGTVKLPQSLQLTEPIILKILSNPSLQPSHKLHFFNWCRSSRHNNNTPSSVSVSVSASAYSLMIRTLCRAPTVFLNHIPTLLHSMTQDGVVLDSHSLNLLLHSLLQTPHNNNNNFHLALQILQHHIHMEHLTPTVYTSLLIASLRNNHLPLALSIFHTLLDAATLVDVDACNHLLAALRKAGMKGEFKRVFRTLRDTKDFTFDTWGYNICIHAFGCWGDLETSLGIFKEMKEKNNKGLFGGPDLCTYNTLISVLCRLGKVTDALIVWEELKGCGFEPDEFTYTTLIQGCSRTFRIDEAIRIFHDMQNNGFRPGTLVYNSLLCGLFKATKVNEACQLFEKMAQEGVKASCSTYNILVHGLIRNGRPEAAYTLFCDLKKKGQFVDGVTYSIIVLQLCKEGQLEEALQLVEEMESRGFAVDLVTITSLLIGIHKHGRWDWTDRLIKYVKEGDLVPGVLRWKAGMEASIKNPPTTKRKDCSPMFTSKGDFSDIMSSFITCAQDTGLGSRDDKTNEDDDDGEEGIDEWSSSSPHMDRLANQAKSTGDASWLFTPTRGQRVQQKGPDSFDIDMVNTFLSIFLAKGKLSLACKLFEIFTDAGVEPVSYTYNSIMSSFVKKGYFNEAWAILSEMGEKLCPTDIATYNMIIQGLGKMGRADLASAILDRLLEQGGYLDIVMYNTLINALGKAGRIDDVNKFFEQMRSSGINPDVVTYNTLIEVHSKAGRLKDAHKFLKMMLDAGCTPNHVTDTTLDYLGREIDKLRYQKATILSEKDDPS